MARRRLALALYTIRDKLKTPSDYADCLRRVREMGYDGVEGSALDSLIDTCEYQKILNGEGLVVCSNHAAQADLENRFQAVVDRTRVLECPAIVLPWLEQRYWSAEGARAIAKFLNDIGAKLRAHGVRLLYHNHHVEFQKFGGKTILEMIYELTAAENVWAELDTYWVQHGGANPVEWIQKMKGRMSHLHCKDKGMVGSDTVFAEIGEGNLNWNAIVKAAKQCGIEWFIVEQDTSRRDSLESAAISARALRALL